MAKTKKNADNYKSQAATGRQMKAKTGSAYDSQKITPIDAASAYGKSAAKAGKMGASADAAKAAKAGASAAKAGAADYASAAAAKAAKMGASADDAKAGYASADAKMDAAKAAAAKKADYASSAAKAAKAGAADYASAATKAGAASADAAKAAKAGAADYASSAAKAGASSAAGAADYASAAAKAGAAGYAKAGAASADAAKAASAAKAGAADYASSAAKAASAASASAAKAAAAKKADYASAKAGMGSSAKAYKAKAKKSMREALPILARIHYDLHRNFSPGKLVGLGMMAIVAVFGATLATRMVSPSSLASTKNGAAQIRLSAATNLRVTYNITGKNVNAVSWFSGATLSGCEYPAYSYKTIISRGRNFGNFSRRGTVTIQRGDTYVCFKVAYQNRTPRTLQTKYVYQRLLVDTKAPVITVRATGLRIDATADKAVIWNIAPLASNAACDASSFSAGRGSQRSRTTRYTIPESSAANSHNKRLCIKAQDQWGNLGFRTWRMEVPANLRQSAPRVTPVVRLSQSLTNGRNIRVVARANTDIGQSNWRYIIPGSQVDCARLFRWYDAGRNVDSPLVTAWRNAIGPKKLQQDDARQAYVYLAPGTDYSERYMCVEATPTGTNPTKAYRQVKLMKVASAPAPAAPVAPTPPRNTPTNPPVVTPPTNPPVVTPPVNPPVVTPPTNPPVVTPPPVTTPETEEIPNTGLLDDENAWVQLSGFILLAGAGLGASRILLVKKYKRAASSSYY